MPHKKKAMTSQKTSFVKRQGHIDARQFAEILGIGKEFRSDPTAKKDVIDNFGYSYSVKSGQKKWQIFLYGESRFKRDFTFRSMNGLGNILLRCIEAFPPARAEYLKNKKIYKEKLKIPMRRLCQKLRQKRLLAGFIDKSMFNSGEVDFLVVKQEGKFHVFTGNEVVEALVENIKVENSKAKTKGQLDDQKVVFKVEGKTIGEIEIRNDSEIHYREVKFWLAKNQTLNLLIAKITPSKKLKENLILYGAAIKKLSKYLRD